MMKKRIVALLLAGLMTTAALASCRVQNSGTPNGTEPSQTTPQNQQTTKPEDTYKPPVETWEDIDTTVYVVLDNAKLRPEANTFGTALETLPLEAALHCTKQSASWYYVEYNGKQGYVQKTSVTETDILGTDMVEVDGGSKVMYVVGTDTLNIRLYPSDNNGFSERIDSYKRNDEVTVLATNGTWARVQYSEDKTYYVSCAFLSDTQEEDANDDSKYAHLFTDVEGEPTMYVDNVSQVKVRKAPNTSSDEKLALEKGESVTVLKAGVVDGKEWKYVVVEVPPQKEGDGPSYVRGYISADCLSYTNGEMGLDELLALYPMFEKTEAITMYIVLESAITIRSTPVFPAEGEDNSLSHPYSTAESIKAIKILAIGEVDGTTWRIVEFTKKNGENEQVIIGFIANGVMSVLTSDPNGKVTLTPDDVLVKYPDQFEKLETPVTVTTKGVANCYGAPETTKDPLKQLAADTQVTLIAKEKGNYVTWAFVQDSEGAYYFVNYSLLNIAQ